MSTAATAVILDPLTITASMLYAGTTIPVVDAGAGEAAYSPSTAYTGVEVKVNHEGWLYTSIAASTGVAPGTDTTKWRRTGPSNRMAPFDDQMNTTAVAAGQMTYVLRPGFFTGLALYGVEAEEIEITLYAAPGGAVIEHWQQEMYEQALGLFEYLYLPLRALTKFQQQNLELFPNAELHVTVRAAAGKRVAIGHLICGFWTTLLGSGAFGGVQYGAGAEVKTYSYIKTNDDGKVTVVPRNTATNITANVVVDSEQINAAFDLLSKVAGKPVAFIASGLPRYDYLNTFGLVSASVSPDTWRTGSISLKVQGFT